MNKLLPFLVVAPMVFTACDKNPENQKSTSTGDDAAAAAATASAPVTAPSAGNAGFHDALTHVVSNLETNGSHLSVTHIDDDIKQLAAVVDGFIDVARKTSNDVPPNLSIVDLLNDLGLDKIDAMGRCSRWNDSAWHNRLFVQTGGSRSGVLSVMGGEGTDWRAGKIAPSDADMVVELELNLRRLKQTIKLVSSSFGEEAEQSFARAMQDKLADGAMTVGDLLGKMDLRATLVMSLDREQRWQASEEVELPAIQAMLRIERGMWLWELFGKEIEADAEVSEKDGLKIVKAPEEMDTPMGKVRPVIVLDETKDLIWVSLTEQYLEKCRSGKSPLATSGDYKKATAGIPAQGNGLFYVSADLCKELLQQLENVRKNMPADGEGAAVFDSLLGSFKLSGDDVPHGYAWSVANTKTGILCVGNAPIPDKGYGMISGIAPISAMAAMATPVIIKQKKKAELTESISNMKQMFYLLIEYDSDFGEFPKQLSEFVKEGYIKQDAFNQISTCKLDGERKPLVYIPGHSTSDHSMTIIMHTPAPIDGKRAFLRIDGAVKMVPEAEFRQLLAKQKAND